MIEWVVWTSFLDHLAASSARGIGDITCKSCESPPLLHAEEASITTTYDHLMYEIMGTYHETFGASKNKYNSWFWSEPESVSMISIIFWSLGSLPKGSICKSLIESLQGSPETWSVKHQHRHIDQSHVCFLLEGSFVYVNVYLFHRFCWFPRLDPCLHVQEAFERIAVQR